MLHSANRVRHGCICWNWAETWGFWALAVLLTHLWVLLQKVYTSKTASARPDVFSRVRQNRRVPLSRRYRPPTVPPQSKFSPERERGLRSKSRQPESLPVHDCPDHNAECPNDITAVLFYFFKIPASITVGVKTWSSLLFLVKL